MASILHEWLPTVLPFLEPWLSSEDIAKGQRWNSEIGFRLNQASYGIVCVTPGVADRAWVNFEAGAIAKEVEVSRVSPLLLKVTPEDLAGLPLSMFQCTRFTKTDVNRLLKSINSAHDSPILEGNVASKLDQTWDWLRERVDAIELHDGEQLDYSGNEDDDADFAFLDINLEEVMALFAGKKGHPVTAAYLVFMTDLNPVRIQHFLDQLVKRGYVRDQLQPDQSRSYTLTEKGRAYVVTNDLDR